MCSLLVRIVSKSSLTKNFQDTDDSSNPDTEYEDDSLRVLIQKTAQLPEKAQLFNYASQIWNNDFFLQSLVMITWFS